MLPSSRRESCKLSEITMVADDLILISNFEALLCKQFSLLFIAFNRISNCNNWLCDLRPFNPGGCGWGQASATALDDNDLTHLSRDRKDIRRYFSSCLSLEFASWL